MRETHNAAGLRTTGTSTSHVATTPHHVGPPTSPPAGADARRDEQPTTTSRSPPAEEEAGERGRHPAHPRRTAAVSRRRRRHIWEEPELRPPPRCFEPPGVQMGAPSQAAGRPGRASDPEQARAGPQEPIRARCTRRQAPPRPAAPPPPPTSTWPRTTGRPQPHRRPATGPPRPPHIAAPGRAPSRQGTREPEKYSVFALLFLCLKTCFHRRDSDHRMRVSTGRREMIVALVVPTKPSKDEISAIALSCIMVHYVY
nr:uncharacterized protein LOC127347046 [Lolium perenne]